MLEQELDSDLGMGSEIESDLVTVVVLDLESDLGLALALAAELVTVSR